MDPAIAAGLKRNPNRIPSPIKTSPHTFKKSTTASTSAFEIIQLERPDKIPFDSCRKLADVHWGLSTFDIPSYNTCQPITNRRINKKISWYLVYFFLLTMIVYFFATISLSKGQRSNSFELCHCYK